MHHLLLGQTDGGGVTRAIGWRLLVGKAFMYSTVATTNFTKALASITPMVLKEPLGIISETLFMVNVTTAKSDTSVSLLVHVHAKRTVRGRLCVHDWRLLCGNTPIINKGNVVQISRTSIVNVFQILKLLVRSTRPHFKFGDRPVQSA